MTTTNHRRWRTGIIVAGWVTLVVCSSCWGATGSTEAFTTGTYAAQDAAPDNLTTTAPPQTSASLEVKGGNAIPDRGFDQGKVIYNSTGSHDATACFAGRSTGTPEGGRSTGWGCTYTVYGIFVGQGDNGTATWWSKFQELDSIPRITLEVNQDGKADDFIAVQHTGVLYVTVQGGNSTEYTVKLEADTGIHFENGLSTASIQVAGQGGLASATLYGQSTPGTVNIAASFDPAITGTVGARATVTVTDIAVTFSKSELRVGVDDQRTQAVTVTATRNGGGAAVTVNLATNNARASVTSGASLTIPQGQNESQQTVTVKGTTVSVTDQDTLLEAKIEGVTKNSIPITVVEPTKWTNNCLGPALSDTTPVASIMDNVPGPDNWWVNWHVPVVFTVLDQFGKPLGSQWAGVLILEGVGTTWCGFNLADTDGTAINAAAQAIDDVRYFRVRYTEDQARAIAAKTILLTPAVLGNTVYSYKIRDGAKHYPLSGTNHRKFNLTGNNDTTNLDTIQ